MYRMVPFGPTSPPLRRTALNPEVLAKPEAQIGKLVQVPQIQKLEPRLHPHHPRLPVGALRPFGAARSGPKPTPGCTERPLVLKLKLEVGSRKPGSVQNGYRPDWRVP
jgi:hypothetical protein